MSDAHRRAETPQYSSDNLGLVTPPYAVVAWEGFCGLAVYTEIKDLCNVQLLALKGFLNESVTKIRQVKPLIL